MGAEGQSVFLNVTHQRFQHRQFLNIRETFHRKPLRQHSLSNHQFAHAIDQLVQLGQIDADRLPPGDGRLYRGRHLQVTEGAAIWPLRILSIQCDHHVSG